jgi:hypothetical protein
MLACGNGSAMVTDDVRVRYRGRADCLLASFRHFLKKRMNAM